MFSQFKPTWMVEAIYQITPVQLQHLGIKAVLTDLDNTLIAWDNPDGTEELKQWILEMKAAGIPVVVVSNNSGERVAHAIKSFDVEYIARAMKPTVVGMKKAQEKLGLTPSELLMVGDQLITDIWSANSAGIRNVLVRPVVDTDGWKTRINRFFERKIMNYLKKKHSDMKWQGEIK